MMYDCNYGDMMRQSKLAFFFFFFFCFLFFGAAPFSNPPQSNVSPIASFFRTVNSQALLLRLLFYIMQGKPRFISITISSFIFLSISFKISCIFWARGCVLSLLLVSTHQRCPRKNISFKHSIKHNTCLSVLPRFPYISTRSLFNILSTP